MLVNSNENRARGGGDVRVMHYAGPAREIINT